MRERRGKEKLVEKMRWRRKMKFGKIIAGWVEELACHQKTSTYHS